MFDRVLNEPLKNLHAEAVVRRCSSKRLCNFIKKKLQCRCFPVKFSKFLRTPFFYKTHLVANPVFFAILALPHERDAGIFSQLIVFLFSQEVFLTQLNTYSFFYFVLKIIISKMRNFCSRLLRLNGLMMKY